MLLIVHNEKLVAAVDISFRSNRDLVRAAGAYHKCAIGVVLTSMVHFSWVKVNVCWTGVDGSRQLESILLYEVCEPVLVVLI